MEKCVKEKEYKGTYILVEQTPTGVNCDIMDSFTGDLLEEYQNLPVTVDEAFEKAKTEIDGFIPEEQLKRNLANGFAYVYYIS